MSEPERGYERLAKRLRHIADSPYVQKYGQLDHPREMRRASGMLMAQAREINELAIKVQTLQQNVLELNKEPVALPEKSTE